MDKAQQLLTITQVAIAIAGFAGIIATFQFKGNVKIRRGNALGLAMIVNTGLVGAFFSILPFILFNFGLNDSLVWTISSSLMSLNYILFYLYVVTHLKKFKVNKTANKVRVSFMMIIGILVLIMNILNSFNVVFKREFGPFFMSLVFPLFIVGFMFSHLLLAPIWRTIRNQDSENSDENNLN